MEQKALQDFQDFLLILGRLEKKAEVKRERLCRLSEFEPYTMFRILDNENKKYIDSQDIWIFLQQNEYEFKVEIEDIREQRVQQSLVDAMVGCTGRMDYQDFLGLVLVRQNGQLRRDVSTRQLGGRAYDQQVEQALVDVISVQLQGQALKYQCTYTLHYKQIQGWVHSMGEQGQVTEQSLQQFFQNNEQYVYQEEVKGILTHIAGESVNAVPLQTFTNYFQSTNSHVPSTNPLHLTQPNFIKANKSHFSRINKTLQHSTPHNQYLDYMINKISQRKSITPTKQSSYIKHNNKNVQQFNLDATTNNISQHTQRKQELYQKQQELDEQHYQYEKQQEDEEDQIEQQQQLQDGQYILEQLYMIMKMEKEVEELKQELSLRPDFNLIDFFIMIDRNQKGYLFFQELVEFVEESGVGEYSHLHLQLFYQKVSGGGIQMKFSQFAEAFTPLHLEYADILNSRKASRNNKPQGIASFTKGTQTLIKRLLQLHLDNEHYLEAVRRDIQARSIDLHKIYTILDIHQQNHLELIEPLSEISGKVVTQKDFNYLINRFDKDNEQVIKEKYFIQELLPKTN